MLCATDYPISMHPFLLRLMGAFQLSFPLDEYGKEHLVPALLPVEESAGIPSQMLQNAQVQLRWEFPVVPGPLLPRLLVRSLGLVKNNWRWRRGAIYSYGLAIAKVWEEKERYIYLSATDIPDDTASGNEAVADLVRMIRGTLREILHEYKNLISQEQVKWNGDWLPRRAAENLKLCEQDEDEGILRHEVQQ